MKIFKNIHLNGATFPNGTMQVGWYNGNDTVHHLTLASESLKIIEPGAFTAKALQDLEILRFSMTSPIEFKFGIWDGLQGLQSLIIGAWHVFQTESDEFLKSLSNTLNSFKSSYGYTTNVVSLNSLFGNGNFLNLNSIAIEFIRPIHGYLKVLAADNFTALSAIQSLSIIDCGVESILEQAFDYIGETLIELNLGYNNIKTMNPSLLNVFFESAKNASFEIKLLNVTNNQFECNCNFYELRNISFLNSRNEIYTIKAMDCQQATGNQDPNDEKCENLQKIDTGRFHMQTEFVQSVAYPKFDLNFDQARMVLAIKNRNPVKYRLLIQNHNDGLRNMEHCPAATWLSRSMKCLMINRTNEQLMIAEYVKETELTTFYIIYASQRKMFWPMHAATIRASVECVTNLSITYIWNEKPLVMLTFVMSSIFGILLGLVVAFYYCKSAVTDNVSHE